MKSQFNKQRAEVNLWRQTPSTFDMWLWAQVQSCFSRTFQDGCVYLRTFFTISQRWSDKNPHRDKRSLIISMQRSCTAHVSGASPDMIQKSRDSWFGSFTSKLYTDIRLQGQTPSLSSNYSWVAALCVCEAYILCTRMLAQLSSNLIYIPFRGMSSIRCICPAHRAVWTLPVQTPYLNVWISLSLKHPKCSLYSHVGNSWLSWLRWVADTSCCMHAVLSFLCFIGHPGTTTV